MFKKGSPFTRKKALTLVAAAVLLMLALILLRSATRKDSLFDLTTAYGRQAFLSSLGWEVDADSEVHNSVIVPERLEGVMEEYNAMQLKQGFDLAKHCGERCEQYTYTLLKYDGYDGVVLVTIYVQGREVIAGDIHTTSINGFMHGLK